MTGQGLAPRPTRVEGTQQLSVAMRLVDRRHLELIELLHRAHEECAKGGNPNCLGEIQEKVAAYAEALFACDHLPKASSPRPTFPELNYFALQLVSIRHALHRNAGVSASTLSFLISWVANQKEKIDATFHRILPTRVRY